MVWFKIIIGNRRHLGLILIVELAQSIAQSKIVEAAQLVVGTSAQPIVQIDSSLGIEILKLVGKVSNGISNSTSTQHILAGGSVHGIANRHSRAEDTDCQEQHKTNDSH